MIEFLVKLLGWVRKKGRRAYYWIFLDKRMVHGPRFTLHQGATIVLLDLRGVAHIQIGFNVYIGRYVNLHTGSAIEIGNNVVFSDYVFVSSLAHGIDPEMGPIMQQVTIDKGAIRIDDDCFIGFGAKIMPGVHLGRWCIVGAGAVVTKSFPSFSMIGGNPAKIIKVYDPEKKEWAHVNNQ